MRINYQLDEFSETVCGHISTELRVRHIPHILEKGSLLIDKVDETEVDEVLASFGNVENIEPLSFPSIINAANQTPQNNYERLLINQKRDQLRASQAFSQKSDDDSGGIALVGALIGGGFGVVAVVGALSDPNYEGPVYLFLPAIIFAVIGFFVGSGIEKGIRHARKKW